MLAWVKSGSSDNPCPGRERAGTTPRKELPRSQSRAGLLPSPPDPDAPGHGGGLRAGGCHFLSSGLGFLLC